MVILVGGLVETVGKVLYSVKKHGKARNKCEMIHVQTLMANANGKGRNKCEMILEPTDSEQNFWQVLAWERQEQVSNYIYSGSQTHGKGINTGAPCYVNRRRGA